MGFLDALFDNTIGKVINPIGKALGGVLNSFGLEGIVEQLSGALGMIPGMDSMTAGLFKMLPDLLNGKFDAEDAIKLGAMFLPPPASAIASMSDLSAITG